MVALLAEGVDRNSRIRVAIAMIPSSPSSRRAWIEIVTIDGDNMEGSVALLAEGVDRN